MSNSLQPMDCSPPGSSVPGILQARILEWVAISFSRESSQPRDRTWVSYVSCIGRQALYHKRHLGSYSCLISGNCFWLLSLRCNSKITTFGNPSHWKVTRIPTGAKVRFAVNYLIIYFNNLFISVIYFSNDS